MKKANLWDIKWFTLIDTEVELDVPLESEPMIILPKINYISLGAKAFF